MGEELGTSIMSHWITLHAFTEGDEMLVNMDTVALVTYVSGPRPHATLHFASGLSAAVRETVQEVAFCLPSPGITPQ